MFAPRYFASSYFTGRYFCEHGETAEPIPAALNLAGPVPYPYPLPPEHIDALARGKILAVQISLLPGRASGSSEAVGDFVFVGNAIATGTPISSQCWKLISGMAHAEIELTEEEEFLLILAEAA